MYTKNDAVFSSGVKQAILKNVIDFPGFNLPSTNHANA